MTEPTVTQKTVKYGANTVGISVGNALAYFALEYLKYSETYVPDDPVVAMAMGGAVMSIALLEARKVFSALGQATKYVFNRFFPEKK